VFVVKVVAPLNVDVPEFHKAPPSVVEALLVKVVVPASGMVDTVKVAVL
jgi:hypothetical protein